MGAERLTAWAATIVLACASCAFGWGEDGHKIVGEIAESRLTNETLREVRALLGGPGLADVATWADHVKGQREYAWSRPLHYVNMPRDADGYEKERDCPGGKCVVEAINRYVGVLSDRERSKEDRAEALRFVVHFVGDLHQPLHASFADDRGGNMIPVSFFGEDRRNLHWVWDTGLLTRRIRDVGWERHAESLHQRITDEQAATWETKTKAGDWADESLAIVKSTVYDLVPLDDAIGQSYYDDTIEIVEERLMRGGVRLASLLNRILGTPQAEAKPEGG